MKLEAGEAHLARYRSSVELLAQRRSRQPPAPEKNNIREKIGKLQATINQYENNLGFFRNSKNMGASSTKSKTTSKRAREEMELLPEEVKAFSKSSSGGESIDKKRNLHS